MAARERNSESFLVQSGANALGGLVVAALSSIGAAALRSSGWTILFAFVTVFISFHAVRSLRAKDPPIIDGAPATYRFSKRWRVALSLASSMSFIVCMLSVFWQKHTSASAFPGQTRTREVQYVPSGSVAPEPAAPTTQEVAKSRAENSQPVGGSAVGEARAESPIQILPPDAPASMPLTGPPPAVVMPLVRSELQFPWPDVSVPVQHAKPAASSSTRRIGVPVNVFVARLHQSHPDDSAPTPPVHRSPRLHPTPTNEPVLMVSAVATYIDRYPVIRITFQNTSEIGQAITRIDINAPAPLIRRDEGEVSITGILWGNERVDIDVAQFESSSISVGLDPAFVASPGPDSLLIRFGRVVGQHFAPPHDFVQGSFMVTVYPVAGPILQIQTNSF